MKAGRDSDCAELENFGPSVGLDVVEKVLQRLWAATAPPLDEPTTTSGRFLSNLAWAIYSPLPQPPPFHPRRDLDLITHQFMSAFQDRNGQLSSRGIFRASAEIPQFLATSRGHLQLLANDPSWL